MPLALICLRPGRWEGVSSTADPQSDAAAPKRGGDESRKRSLVKTLSWRVVATTTTFLIAWLVTGDPAAGAAIGSIEAVAKMFLYYGHERAWAQLWPSATSMS